MSIFFALLLLAFFKASSPIIPSDDLVLPRIHAGTVFYREPEHMITGHAPIDIYYQLILPVLNLPDFPKFRFQDFIAACHKANLYSDKPENSFYSPVRFRLQCNRFKTAFKLLKVRLSQYADRYQIIQTEYKYWQTYMQSSDLDLRQDFAQTRRPKRLIGTIVSTGWGLFADDERRKLWNHYYRVSDRMDTLKEHFVMITNKTNEAIELLRQDVDATAQVISHLQSWILNLSLSNTYQAGSIRLMEHYLFSFTSVVLHMDELQHLILTMNQYTHAFRQLRLQRVSPFLLDVDTLETDYRNLARDIKNRYPDHGLAVPNMANILDTGLTQYFFDNGSLVLIFTAHFNTLNQCYIYYTVHAIPVPLDPLDPFAGYTILDHYSPYFAISIDGSHYATFDHIDRISCYKHHHLICPMHIPVSTFPAEDCLAALFANTRERSHTYCNFTVYPGRSIVPSALAIGDNKYIVSTQTLQYAIQCQKYIQVLDCPTYFQLHLPCNCKATIGNKNLMTPGPTCYKSYNLTHTSYFSVNFAFLAHFEHTPSLIADLKPGDPFIFLPVFDHTKIDAYMSSHLYVDAKLRHIGLDLRQSLDEYQREDALILA
jgi:hypothetical protein